MARYFNAGPYLSFGTAVTVDFSSPPISCSFFINPNAVNNWYVGCGQGASFSRGWGYYYSRAGSNLPTMSIFGATDTSGSAAFTTDVWQQGGFKLVGTTLTHYKSGVTNGSGTIGTFIAPSGDQMRIAAVVLGFSEEADARLANMMFWNADLSVDEWKALGEGYSPLLIRPASQLFFCPINGNLSPEPELIAGLSGTITGTPAKTSPPRLILPSAQILQFPQAAAGGVPITGISSASAAGSVAQSHLLSVSGVEI